MSLTVLPNSDGYPTPETVSDILRNSHPTRFRNVLHPHNTPVLRFYDSLSLSGREYSCVVHLHESSHLYTVDIVRLKDMPTAPFIHVLIDHLRKTLTSLEDLPDSSESLILSLNNLLLEANGKPLSSSSNALFKEETNSVLRRAVDLLPQSSRGLLTTMSLYPTLVSPATSLSPHTATNPPEHENPTLAFIRSLAEIDSHQEIVQAYDSDPIIDPRTQTVYRIAKTLVRLLRDRNFDCALFGSAACWLYGNTRVPNVR